MVIALSVCVSDLWLCCSAEMWLSAFVGGGAGDSKLDS